MSEVDAPPVDPANPGPPPAAPAPEPTPEPESTPTPEPESEPVGHWRDSLGEDIREAESLKKFDTQDDLAKSYVELNKKIGANTIVVPGPNATDEDKAAYRTAVGVPENASDYKFPTEGLPDIQMPEGSSDLVRDVAHKIGLTPVQAADLFRAFVNSTSDDNKAYLGKLEEAKAGYETTMRQKWGNGFDELVALSDQALTTYGGTEFMELMKDCHLDRHPLVLGLGESMGKTIKEHAILGDGGATSFRRTPAECKQRIAEIQAMPEYKKPGPRQKELHMEVTTLYEEIDPPEADKRPSE